MKLLIAGFGDLGQTIVDSCQEKPHWQNTQILAVRRNPPAPGSTDRVHWIRADLSDPSSMAAIKQQAKIITHVVYCAAPSERSEEAYRATYLFGLQNLVRLLQSAKGHERDTNATPIKLLFVSSTAVYDSQAAGTFDETSPTEPRAFNGKLLLQAENWLLANWPDALVLRLSGIYGPSKQGLLNSIAAGTSTVPETDDYIANRIHIQDAARAILHLFETEKSGIFIGTDSHPMPLATLYQSLAKMLHAPAPAIGTASPMMGKKQLSNQKLLATGFQLKWPDCLEGYRELINLKKTDRL